MARDLNQVTIIGRLVKDPEIKYTASGTPVTKFSLANNVTYSQGNERKEYVNYFDINVWGNQAVNCEKYLKKGSQVAVNGSLRQNRWQDQASGQTRSKIEITAMSVQFLTSVGPGADRPGPAMGPGPQQMPQHQPQPQQQQGFKPQPEVIQDPWGDSGSGTNTPDFDPYAQPFNNDDDIPF